MINTLKPNIEVSVLTGLRLTLPPKLPAVLQCPLIPQAVTGNERNGKLFAKSMLLAELHC